MCDYVPLPGEGDVEIVRRIHVRRECVECGEPATIKQTYLLPNCRRNPASKAYGRDDCTWCEDEANFYCDACWPAHQWDEPQGYERCSTFRKPEKWPHLFLQWQEHSRKTEEKA